jgi:hypothetical protein
MAPLLLLALTLLQDPAPQVSAEVDRERVGVGDVITLTVRAVVRPGSAVMVTLPRFEGFTQVGREERRQPPEAGATDETFILELRLRAQRVGLFSLGPVVLGIGPRDLTVPEVEVGVEAGSRPPPPALGPRVLDLLARAPPPASGDVAVTLLVSSDSVIVGEQVDIVTAAWFPRELLGRLRRPPNLQPPSIDGMYTAVQPATAGVAASRMVGGAWYDLYVAHKIAFPVSEGEFTIPPAGLSFSVPAGRQYFSEERAYTLTSRPRRVHVRPVPPGGPGPVARDLALGYELRPEPARAGEPIRIDLVLSGVGNSALWPRPVVSWPDGSRGYPEAIEDRPMVRSGIVGGLRRFRFVVIADSAGSLALPEVRYPYFDPGRGWRDALARPVVLPVQPAPPLERQRPAPTLLEREPLGLTGLGGWVLWLLLALGLVPPLAFVAVRLRAGPRAPEPPRTIAAPERLQAEVRRLVPYPERRREEELVASLREAGFDQDSSEEIARLYYQVAVRRFAPSQAGGEDIERRAEQALARWPRRVRVAALAGSALLFAAGPVRAQSSGDSLYAEGRYAGAAALYHQAAAAEPSSPRRWYAAGAAAWAAEQNASAAAAWLRALRLAPRSPDVRQAWRQVSRLSADLQQAGRVPPVTPVELFVVAGVLWAGGWGLLILRHRRSGVAALVAAGIAVGTGAWIARQQSRPIAVLARTVRVREAPHGLAEESGTADELSVVRLMERRGGWRLVEAPRGLRGWVPVTAMAEVGVNSRP